MEEKFVFKKKHRNLFLGLIAIGVISLIVSMFLPECTRARIWSNVLLNNIYFISLAVCGGVFLSLHYIASSGWHTALNKVPFAITSFLPYGGLLMLVFIAGVGDVYHWTHPGEHDEILQNKAAYLNLPFFIARMVVIIGGWVYLIHLMKKNTRLLAETGEVKYFKRNKTIGSLFIAFFAVSSSVAAWDWLMSIDAHWYSTLYGWYFFIGLFVSGIAFLILFIAVLHKAGYLQFITKEHVHDLGKYLFAFSVFWAYLWFSQYILIWYGHIPEETVYYHQRFEEFRTVFFISPVFNFVIPFFALMTRGSKRNLRWIAIISVSVLIGHWFDLYQLIMPGAVGKDATIGLIEVGLTCGYTGLFLLILYRSIAGKMLVTKNEPLLEESLTYEA